MIGLGIAAGLFAYAMIYSGVKDMQGMPTGILECLHPGYKPRAAAPPAGKSLVGSIGNALINIPGSPLNPIGQAKKLLGK
jgi:hypothetical protein